MKKIKKLFSKELMTNNLVQVNTQKFYVLSSFEYQEHENLFFQEQSIQKLERNTRDPYMTSGDSISLLRDLQNKY